ncbi:unnamed protein product, partial [Aphanomyces euteiches]
YEMEIKWRGLEVQENSWEPVVNLQEDVPALQKHLKANKMNAMVAEMVQALGWQKFLEG